MAVGAVVIGGAAVWSAERIAALFASIDNADADLFAAFLTKDASFRFGSAPRIRGRVEIAAGVGAFFATIAACKHQVVKTILSGDSLICEGEVTYTRHDGANVTVPFVDMLELSGDLIRDYKVEGGD